MIYNIRQLLVKTDREAIVRSYGTGFMESSMAIFLSNAEFEVISIIEKWGSSRPSAPLRFRDLQERAVSWTLTGYPYQQLLDRSLSTMRLLNQSSPGWISDLLQVVWIQEVCVLVRKRNADFGPYALQGPSANQK
jgi:hypothetical protein